MARKNPGNSAQQRTKVREAIRESEEEILNRVRREALEGIRRLNPRPLPTAPYELWPGESYELGGWGLAQGKKKRKSNGGMA